MEHSEGSKESQASNDDVKANRAYGQFLLEVASHLSAATVRKLAVVLGYSPVDVEKAVRDPNPGDVFVMSLRDKGFITPTDISTLLNILNVIGLPGVSNAVMESFERNLSDTQSQSLLPSKDQEFEEEAFQELSTASYEQEPANQIDTGPTHLTSEGSFHEFLSRNLGPEWESVGRELGLDYAELYRIKVEKRSIQEAIYGMLVCWKQKKGSRATYSNLFRSLKKAGRRDLAEKLQNLEEFEEEAFQELSTASYEQEPANQIDTGPTQLTSEIKVPPKGIEFLSRNLGPEWESVGRELGLDYAELYRIKVEKRSIQEAIYGMLVCWKQKKGSRATYSNLFRSLKKAGRRDLAEKLQNLEVQVTSYGWFLATLSAHLTASVPGNLCGYFNIVDEKKNSIKSSRNPGLSLLLALDEKGKIKSSEVEALWQPLTDFKLVQAAAKVKEYQKQNEERRLHVLVMSNFNLDGRRKLFIQCLRQKIKSWYETMTPVPWKKSCKWKATDLFVTCGLILTDSKSKVHPTNIDSDCKLQYGDILTHQSLKLESRLILEGEPGSGKTMLSSQLAYDWSQNKFANVELLVFLPLKFVGEMTLAEAMEKFYISDHIPLTESDLDEILESGKLETCIILDGLEEYNAKVIEEKGESSEVHKVMSKFKYPNCKVVITARSDYAQDLPACPMLKIGEFGETERNTYIEKLFPDDKVKQEKMQSVIKETPFILDLCSVPLLFVLVVHNFESINKCDEDQLEKVTPLMKSIDDTLCKQIYDNEKHGSMAEMKYSKQRAALELLAFTGLCRGSQKLSWQKDDVEEIIENVKEWIDAGILVVEDDITVKVKDDVEPEDYPVPSTSGLLSQTGGLQRKGKGTTQAKSHQQSDSTKSGWEQKPSGSTAKQVPMSLKFLHKLFQEWFAAKHLSSKIWSSKRYSFTDELKFIDPIDLHHILRFTCYLCPPCCHLVLSHLLRMYRESVGGKREPIMDCICLCFMEHNETKGDDIKLVVREICKESIIIRSQDSRLLQHSKTEILKFASQCQIPIMNLELRDVVTAVEERIPSLTLKQDVTLALPDSVQLIKISQWNATLNENDCRHLVDLIATSQSVKHAILELPHQPPRLEDKALLNVADNNIRIEWEIGRTVSTLNPQTGEWVMSLKEHSSSITKAPPDNTYPDQTESEKKKQLSTTSLPGTSTDSIKQSAIWETKKRKGHDTITLATSPQKKAKGVQEEVPFSGVAQSQPVDYQYLLETKATITQTGGVLEIPNTGVVLIVPPNALPENMEECEMHLRIIPRRKMKEQVTSFSSNSSTIVELLPNSLDLHRPVRLSLPHCLVLQENLERRARIFISHHRKGSQPQWEEHSNLSYHLEDTACIIFLNKFCWVKYSINDEIVKAKKLVVYTAARKIHPQDMVAEIHAGYFVDLPDEQKVVQDTRDLVVANRKIFYFRRMEEKYPLRVSLDNIFPSEWKHDTTKTHFQEITYKKVRSSQRSSVIYTLTKNSNTACNPMCVFTVSQENGQIPVQLAIHLKAIDEDPLPARVMEQSNECSLVEQYEVIKTITQTGGSLKIPDSEVVLEIPEDALPADMDQCLIWMRIIPSRIVEDQVKSVCSNSSTAVEIFPSNLRLRHPVKLNLPHCLEFKKSRNRTARIFKNNEEGSQSPWKEMPSMVYELKNNACIVYLNEFGCVKYFIDDTIVRAKRITVYTAAKKIKEKDELAEVEVGYYSDIPGERELLRLNPNLVVDSQRTLLCLEKQNLALRLSLDSIKPQYWTCCIPKEKPQEIPFTVIASSMEHSHLYILQKGDDQPGNVLCYFTASQEGGLTSMVLSLSLCPQEVNQASTQNSAQRNTEQRGKTLELDTIQWLSTKLGTEWKAVCRNLELEDAELEQLRETNSNLQEVIFQCILKWRRRKGSAATVGILSDALRGGGRTDLAEKIFEH